MAEPGCGGQHLHPDGPHPGAAGLYHVFVPLVDIAPDGDGTTFWPGSHLDGSFAERALAYNAGTADDSAAIEDELVAPPAARGDLICFDWRCVHAGRPCPDRTRPVAYFVVNTRDDEFDDRWNWSEDTLL